MRKLATLLAVLASLCVPVSSRAAAPTVLVAGRVDGALVRLALDGTTVTTTRVLVAPREDVSRIPAQVARGLVSVSTWTSATARNDAMLVDPRTGRVVEKRLDARTGQLLVSPDGRTRYVSVGNDQGSLTGVLRTDAHGRLQKALVPADDANELSGVALSRDGRTLYVANSTSLDEPSVLYAVDTATGARRTITYVATGLTVVNTTLSPDGATLALTLLDYVDGSYRIGLVATSGGVVAPVGLPAQSWLASGFLPDGRILAMAPDGEPALAVADPSTRLVTRLTGGEGLLYALAVP